MKSARARPGAAAGARWCQDRRLCLHLPALAHRRSSAHTCLLSSPSFTPPPSAFASLGQFPHTQLTRQPQQFPAPSSPASAGHDSFPTPSSPATPDSFPTPRSPASAGLFTRHSSHPPLDSLPTPSSPGRPLRTVSSQPDHPDSFPTCSSPASRLPPHQTTLAAPERYSADAKILR